MRTTLTLDDDVAALLDQERRRRRVKLKQLVNEALRAGLTRLNESHPRRAPSRTSTVALGKCKIASLDDVAEALAVAEGESFR